MQHILSLEGDDLKRLGTEVFPKIRSGETILFLGAGASVTDEKRYLGNEIIDFYSDAKSISLDTRDLTDFVDTLSAMKDFNRDEFDEYVAKLLRKLKVAETHRIIASCPWKEIITTNYDLLMESAFNEVENTPRERLHCVPIRQAGDYGYRPANDEVKYVKLNGCLSDKKKYKFVFSTKDFDQSKKFYTTVLKSLENLSSKINFLSVGYSYRDAFAKRLLDRFDKFNFRNKNWLLNLDPFVEEARLEYFASQRICVIKAQSNDFFSAYQKWDDDNISNYLEKNRTILVTNANRGFSVSPHIKMRINGNIIQLADGNSFKKVSPNDFYCGEEPNYQVIQDKLDVVKEATINRVVSRFKELMEAKENIIPTLVLEGSFGTGKSTLSYRAASRLVNDPDLNCVAFEVLNADKLNSPDLEEVFAKSKADTIVLLFNGIELDYVFKSLIRLRNRLSIEQFSGFRIVFLGSMRENVLAEFLREHDYQNFHRINIDTNFIESEADDLVTKLQAANLVEYRDAREKGILINQVLSDYAGDNLVTLIALVSKGTHQQTIRDAYTSLDENAKKVFLYTSLLYRFGILMPVSLLRRLIDISWEDFAREIIPYNFKNFVIQVEAPLQGTDPDLFFKTKHSIISEKLVELLLPDEDAKLEKYEFLFRKLTDTHFSAELAVNLLKIIRHNQDLSFGKIDRLFDVCATQFHEDPQFNLHYAINLQHRKDEESLKRALSRITYAESFLEYRNHRLIHRKALLHFHLAKLLFKAEGLSLKETFNHIDQAEDFFEIKLILDPFSSYSPAGTRGRSLSGVC